MLNLDKAATGAAQTTFSRRAHWTALTGLLATIGCISLPAGPQLLDTGAADTTSADVVSNDIGAIDSDTTNTDVSLSDATIVDLGVQDAGADSGSITDVSDVPVLDSADSSVDDAGDVPILDAAAMPDSGVVRLTGAFVTSASPIPASGGPPRLTGGFIWHGAPSSGGRLEGWFR